MKRWLIALLVLLPLVASATTSELTRADTAKVSAGKKLVTASTAVESLYVTHGTGRVYLSAEGVSASVTRTASFQDKNGTIALTSDIPDTTNFGADTLTVHVVFSSAPSPSHSTDIAPYDAIVDSAGHGDFTTIQGALNAGAKTVYVRNGTYAENVTVFANNTKIVGSGKNAVVNGSTAGHAVAITGTGVMIQTLAVKTTAGGGQSYDGFKISGAQAQIDGCWVLASDLDGIEINIGPAIIRGTEIYSSDRYGILVNSSGDNSEINSNREKDSGTNSLFFVAGGDNCVAAGNRLDGAINDGGSGNIHANLNNVAAW